MSADAAKRDALATIMEGQGVVTWDAARLESELEAHPSKKQANPLTGRVGAAGHRTAPPGNCGSAAVDVEAQGS